MRPTIKDIASDTGLSITTISLVLNSKAENIPPRTKKRIFESVEKLGYRPNQIAVGLVKKRSYTVGLIISDIQNQFFATLAKGAEDECRRHGWNMILCNTNDEHQNDLNYINVLADKGVDGIIYGMSVDTNFEMAQECCNKMDHLNLPFIMADRYFDSLPYNAVIVDHQLGGYMATKHLIERGHRRIACVTGPNYLVDSALRLQGYQRAMEEAGLSVDSEIIYEGRYTMESGMDAMEFLRQKNFTAVFAFNDMMAYGVYLRARSEGLSVPKDFALVGYDDILFSQILETPLTTVHQPVYEMGMGAAQQLIQMIEGESPSQKYNVFTPTLVERKSS